MISKLCIFLPKSSAPVNGVIKAGSEYKADGRHSNADYISGADEPAAEVLLNSALSRVRKEVSGEHLFAVQSAGRNVRVQP
ncbi:MAG TPA: hypothetical protein VK504_21080, partial [Vicinamibacterales bacterium]|nr:hypothetical protein [Vicinamibacterales bacterium]